MAYQDFNIWITWFFYAKSIIIIIDNNIIIIILEFWRVLGYPFHFSETQQDLIVILQNPGYGSDETHLMPDI